MKYSRTDFSDTLLINFWSSLCGVNGELNGRMGSIVWLFPVIHGESVDLSGILKPVITQNNTMASIGND